MWRFCLDGLLLFALVQTGADGCICHMEYVKLKDQKLLEFIGMKQVRELTSVQSLFYDQNSFLDLTSNLYAIGFASTDFLIWNLITESKVYSISFLRMQFATFFFHLDLKQR